ncbi:hypothetical protein HHK36_026074 [Tetracentron sinense]|uniref:Trafficking protein particle complex subunit 2 n=1 Tax=Tetracentron sinense TaxID=13715 RepID=A0A834YIK0_TETSI|nr:hypothetical protein HHK36_026074 [Tetracentron sinense]
MASTTCFIIVSRNDIPIYEAEVGSAVKKEDAAHQHQFILHVALDIVQDLAWTTSAMFLKAVDRFNDLVVSVYVTADHILHIFKLFYKLTFLLFSQRGQSHKSTYKRCSFDLPSLISFDYVLVLDRFFSIPSTYLVPALHHHILIQKFELSRENISRHILSSGGEKLVRGPVKGCASFQNVKSTPFKMFLVHTFSSFIELSSGDWTWYDVSLLMKF